MVQGSLFGPGARLRDARQAAGLTLQQVSAETRISLRHLEMIEREQFGQLPGRTYAIGFSRSYARFVGLKEAEIAADVRAALEVLDPDHYRPTTPAFEPGDPARIPSARLGWLMAAAAVVLLIGAYSFYRSFFAPAGELPSLITPSAPKPARTGPAQAISPTGTVVFKALEEGVWVKFYDGEGRQLMQKQMAMGETYTVPADAQAPQLWTGRHDALAIAIGGRAVPRLAEQERVMKDVLVTAEALLARGSEPAVAAPSPPARPATQRRRPATPRTDMEPQVSPQPETPLPAPPQPAIPAPETASPTG